MIDDRTPLGDYPLPNIDNYQEDDIPRLREALTRIAAAIATNATVADGKAPTIHTHSIEQIIGLATALANRAALYHLHALDDLSDVDAGSAANGQVIKRVGTRWQAARILLGDVEGWEATVTAQIASAIAGLRAGAPGTLDTLDKLAAAIGDDPNFNATILNALATKFSSQGGFIHGSVTIVAEANNTPLVLLGSSGSAWRAIVSGGNLTFNRFNRSTGVYENTPLGITSAGDISFANGSLVTALANKSDRGHQHQISEIVGLVTALAAKAAFIHPHAQDDITGLVAALAGKQPAGNYYTSANIGVAIVNVIASTGAVGSLSLLKYSGTATPNLDIAGSALQFSGTDLVSGGAPAGTWRCLGHAGPNQATLYVRIV